MRDDKWHGHGIFDQDCLLCRIKELEAENKQLWSEQHEAQRVYRQMQAQLQALREAAQKTSDKAEDICNIYSELDLHVLDIDMVWELIHLCNNDSELAALLEKK